MTLLLSDPTAHEPQGPAAAAPVHATAAERLVARAGRALTRRDDRGRRSFLRRAAMVGTALAVNPFDFILKPQTAYASVCGPANECSQGWTAFCCTINGGANTCPPGSYVAGWWKVSSSAFCRGEDRYVIDCNREPGASCRCRCASGSCDRRRVCCNNFRYGQCNQQVKGTTEVVCRVVICTPPWEWDESCTTTVRTDERTREHSSTCLNGPNPTEIAVVYQDLGLVGSTLGAPTADEADAAGGGSWRRYDNGVIVRAPGFGIAVVTGAAGLRYAELGGPDGDLGYVVGEPVVVAGGQVIPTERGALYSTPAGQVFALTGVLHDEYSRRGGPEGWMGFPASGVLAAPGGRSRLDTASGWSLVHDPSGPETRLLPVDVGVSGTAGEWPPTAGVTRWQGDTRVLTAVQVSREARPDGARTAVLAAADAFADALAGGVLAATARGPVLLTGAARLDPATAQELERLAVEEVVLVGGEAVLAPEVQQDVQALLPEAEVVRLAGDGRFATAAAVSGRVAPDGAATVYLANGRDYPDALAASPAAGAAGAPLLLVEADDLPDATQVELRRLEPTEVVVVGGEAAVSARVVDRVRDLTGAEVRRLEGASRFDTAVAVAAQEHPGTAPAVLVATGEAFPDALAAGAAAALVSAPLLLVTGAATPRVTREAIERLEPDLLVVIGGPAAVADHVVEQLGATPTGPHPAREGEQTAEPPTPPEPAGPGG